MKYGLQADNTILCALHVWPSQAKVTSVKLFSSLKCLKEVTIFDWKSFHFKKNCCCWSAIIPVYKMFNLFYVCTNDKIIQASKNCNVDQTFFNLQISFMAKLTTSVKVGYLSLTSTMLNNKYITNLFIRFKPKTIIVVLLEMYSNIITNATCKKNKNYA